jgi:hypothetical protein
MPRTQTTLAVDSGPSGLAQTMTRLNSRSATMDMTSDVGIDIGKNSFYVVDLDRRGAIVLRQKWSRSQIWERFVRAMRSKMSRVETSDRGDGKHEDGAVQEAQRIPRRIDQEGVGETDNKAGYPAANTTQCLGTSDVAASWWALGGAPATTALDARSSSARRR